MTAKYRSERGLPVHFLYHVPKCAGQTIHRHLTPALQGGYYRTQKQRGWGRLVSPPYDPGQLTNPNRIRVIGGQFLGASLENYFAGREIKRSILLRDPVSHLISYYNFRMMRYISQGLHPYSFRLGYLATQRNFISHFILRNFLEFSWLRLALLSDEDKYDIVNAFLANFWYVGDYRLCDDLITALAAELSVPLNAAPQNTRAEWERRVAWQGLDLSDFAPSAIAQMRRENLVDQRLWETWNDSRHRTADIRPGELNRRNVRGFVRLEAIRMVSQIVRRVRRRFGPFRHSLLPVAAPACPSDG
jgi:hypothetical protein